jgi:hypothetical protein
MFERLVRSSVVAEGWRCTGFDTVRLVRCLVLTIRLQPEPGQSSNSMEHMLDDMVMADHGWLLRIVFWHEETVLQLQLNFGLTFKMFQGCMCKHKPYVDVCIKIICGRENHVYGSCCLATTTGPKWLGHGPWWLKQDWLAVCPVHRRVAADQLWSWVDLAKIDVLTSVSTAEAHWLYCGIEMRSSISR